MKLLLSSIAAIAAATALVATAANITLNSSLEDLPLPNDDGSFSEISSNGHSVRHIYYIISEEEHTAYTNAVMPSEAIFNAFLAGEIGEVCLSDEVTTDGYSAISLDEIFYYYDEVNDIEFCYDKYFGYGEKAFFAVICTYTNETTGTSYYIAQTTNTVTLTAQELDANPFDIRAIDDIAANAGRWEVVAAAPPAPLEIECTNIAVSGGTVTVTYQVSDISGFAVGSTVNFSVAYSLARNASGALATETLSGTINSIDASASTFTATLSPPANTTSLFILGIDD